jgi:hypothetical protein
VCFRATGHEGRATLSGPARVGLYDSGFVEADVGLSFPCENGADTLQLREMRRGQRWSLTHYPIV